jgi:hypothetical protein
MKARISLAVLLTSILSASDAALAIPATQWMESGVNLVWVNPGGPDGGSCPALTIGGGTSYAPDRNDFSLRGLSPPYDWFLPTAFTDNTPLLDGGQYFCYVVDGNLAVTSQAFSPQQYSFACSQVPPYLDLSPTLVLDPTYSSTFTVATCDAGFAGSIFKTAGGLAWQPWFRNGEQVLFDMPAQLPVNPTIDAGIHPVIPTSVSLPPIDPGFVVGSVIFTSGGPTQQTLNFPQIYDVGEVVELQLTNSGANNQAYVPAQVRVIALYPGADERASVIGEATVGGLFGPAGAGLSWSALPHTGYVRSSTYAIDSSDYMFNLPPNSLTLDIGGTTLATTQTVTVAVVLHGYHEPVK